MFFKLKPFKIPLLFKKYVMRAGPQLRVAKAARAPPCTLPILAQAPTLRLNHGHTSMAAALALIGCGRRFILTTTISNHLITQKSRIIPKKKCFVINAKKEPSRSARRPWGILDSPIRGSYGLGYFNGSRGRTLPCRS